MSVIETDKANKWTRVLLEATWVLVYPISLLERSELVLLESDTSSAKEP